MDAIVKSDPSLNGLNNMNAVCKEVFRKLKDGDYVLKGSASHLLKDEKTKQEILKLKLNNRLTLIRDFHIEPEKSAIVTAHKIPIEQVVGGMNDSPIPNVQNSISPYDEKNDRLECNECGVLFPIKSHQMYDLMASQNRYLVHISDKHHRTVTDVERDAFKKLGVPL